MNITETNFNWSGTLTNRSKTNRIILHHAAASSATVEQIHQIHLQKGWSGIGYHFFIRKDGGVYRGRPLDKVGSHASNANNDSIGICFEGNFELEQITNAQLSSGRELIAYLFQTCGILVVLKHRDVGVTACPGKNFPDAEELLPLSSRGPSSWAKDAAEWAVEHGLFLGDANGDFRWTDTVTREELAAVCKRFAESPSTKTQTLTQPSESSDGFQRCICFGFKVKTQQVQRRSGEHSGFISKLRQIFGRCEKPTE
ncbi:MAG: peptidoglycan recognition protein family protein [Oscillospiraceae bacterium]|jgi:hypothetical protein|nr:peptidoglycan recognition protein family protein [Oscillospiraceae bacterium]